MGYSKYIKDVRVRTGEFYIAKKISKDRYKIIFIKGSWGFQSPDSDIVDEKWVFTENDGKYKSEYISKQEAFLEML